MSEERGPSHKIKVVDRRRFTADGEVRPDREPIPESTAAQERPQGVESRHPEREVGGASPQASAPAAADKAQVASSPLFLELVATLAQQAEMLLVGAPGLPKQPQQAQRLIDYLGVLEIKTRENLSPEEKQILATAVFQLRTLFVQDNA